MFLLQHGSVGVAAAGKHECTDQFRFYCDSLNSLSVRVLYIFSMASECIAGSQIGGLDVLEHCVYKTIGFFKDFYFFLQYGPSENETFVSRVRKTL